MSKGPIEDEPWTATEAIAYLAFGGLSEAAEAPRRQSEILARWHPSPDYILKLFIESDEVGLDGLGGEYLGLLELRKMEIKKKAQRHFEWAEIRALLINDLAWMETMRAAARRLVSACRAGRVTPWGTPKGQPSQPPSFVPRINWVRGVVIFGNAMSVGDAGSMNDYDSARGMNSSLYAHLEFDPEEVRKLRQAPPKILGTEDGSQRSPDNHPSPAAIDNDIQPSAAESRSAPEITERKRHGGRDYRPFDAPLILRLIRGLDDGTFLTAWDGALAISADAKGKGDAESKAKRLLTRLPAKYKSIQN